MQPVMGPPNEQMQPVLQPDATSDGINVSQPDAISDGAAPQPDATSDGASQQPDAASDGTAL